MPSYHFDLGNSSNGPIGMCARVTGESPEEALQLLQAVLPEEVKVPLVASGLRTLSDTAKIEYVRIYISPDNIKLSHIDDEESDDDEEERDHAADGDDAE